MAKLQNDFDSYHSFEVTSYQSLVAHELGHNAHICLAMKRCGFDYGMPLTYTEALRLQKQMNSVIDEIYDLCFPEWKEKPGVIVEKSIADFGMISIQTKNELIGQAFGKHYFGKNKSKIADKIVDFFKEELNQHV